MQNVLVLRFACVLTGLGIGAAVENLRAHIPQSETGNEPDTEFLLSFSSTNTAVASNFYNVVLRAPVEACAMAPQLGIYLNCSSCNPDAFQPYTNVARADVHNPYDRYDTTQYIRLDLCAEKPIEVAYYVVVNCYHYSQNVKCENYNQSRCLYMRPSLIQQISCPSSASIDGLVDQKQEWSLKGSAQGMSPSAGTGLKSNSVNSPESPVRQDEQYVFESVKVSLFRFILSLLLLTLSGYAGCRWYARSSQRLPTTRRTNRTLSDAFNRTFGVGGNGGSHTTAGLATGLRHQSRSSMLFATNYSTNRCASSRRGTGSLVRAARLSSPTRIVVVDSRQAQQSAGQMAGGANGSEIQQQYGGAAVDSLTEQAELGATEMDESLDACMRVLMRRDPNFAVQFAKYYRNSNSASFACSTNNTTAASATSHASNTNSNAAARPYSQSSSVLPSYQEAISSASLLPPAVGGLSLVHQFAPPPYSASDFAAATNLARLAPPPPASPPVQCSENRAASTTEAEEQQMTLPITCITSSPGVQQLVVELPSPSRSCNVSSQAEAANHRPDAVERQWRQHAATATCPWAPSQQQMPTPSSSSSSSTCINNSGSSHSFAHTQNSNSE